MRFRGRWFVGKQTTAEPFSAELIHGLDFKRDGC